MALEQTPAVLPESLPSYVRARGGASTAPRALTVIHRGDPERGGDASLPDLGEGFDLEARGEEFYRHYIALALERAGGVQTRAAELLGMSFRSFRYYAKKFNLR